MEHDHGSTSDRATAPGPTVGVHGMLVAGGQRTDSAMRSPVYASHLPMFMPPHDFQVIMRVAGPAAATYGDFVAHFGSSDIYTFRPEPFSIADLDPSGGVPALRSVRGSLFRGHFERGGSQIATDVSLEVEHVIWFRRFSAHAAHDVTGQLRYLCFGQPDAAFLAHLITAPPDFDQILSAAVGSVTGVSDEDLHAGLVITVPDRPDDLTHRLTEADAFSGQLQAGRAGAPGSIELKILREHYLETGDLAAAM
jgi:hypothetical protein